MAQGYWGKVDQARCLKELEQKNAKLKRLVSELSLEKLVLTEIFYSLRKVRGSV